ncbi:MAG TPA: substrate-binding domain-containing protein, partial [Planctomycetota bacterium]|nr:substrate-binding domain-containing protein [Planctomycetota bacterium]
RAPREAEGAILVYCAAGIRPPVEAGSKALGSPVEISYGGSQTLLATAEVSRKGDLFIPGDESYLELARAKGLIAETIPLARMRPVLAVGRGNPKGIRSVQDLERPEVKVSFPSPEATASGKLVQAALRKAGRWAALEARRPVSKPTVNDVANDLRLGVADAGFVWDATVRQFPELVELPVPELGGVWASISAGVFSWSARPAAALRLARYLAAPDRGGPAFEREGYEPAGGDLWEERPEILLFGGAMLRPAIEPTIQAFERREGCQVTRVYDGCGILVGQMRTGVRPDLYFACDRSFMAEVKDRFPAPQDVSMNQLVILVKKGNPSGIRSLKDLARPGLRVGIGNEKQCALGVLTQETLVQTKLRDPVEKNIVTRVPTGDLLVNQMRSGALDAVVAYLSNAAGSAEILEAIRVDLPCAMATQPVAVDPNSPRRRIASRLVERLRSAESKAAFLSEGFQWKEAP